MSRGFGIKKTRPTCADAKQETPRQCEDVIERQCSHDKKLIDLGWRIDHRLIPRLNLQHVGDKISMEQHRALRDSGGAARVLQESNVIGSDRRSYKFQFASGRERIVEFNAIREGISRNHLLDVADDAIDKYAFDPSEHVAHAGNHNVPDGRPWQCLFEHRREVLKNYDCFSAGISELEFQFAWLVQRVDVHHRVAGSQNRDNRNRVLQNIRHHDGNAGATFQPEAL